MAGRAVTAEMREMRVMVRECMVVVDEWMMGGRVVLRRVLRGERGSWVGREVARGVGSKSGRCYGCWNVRSCSIAGLIFVQRPKTRGWVAHRCRFARCVTVQVPKPDTG